MLTKFNDMNTFVSNEINSYIKDGYHIDINESTFDHEEDKDCIFKTVLKKDVDGIECKTVITLNGNEDDKTKYYTYHKVETVGDTKWSEETQTYNCITDKYKLNSTIKDNFLNKTCNDVWAAEHRKRRKCLKLISDKHGFRWIQLNEDSRDSACSSKESKIENTKCDRDSIVCSTKLSEDLNKPDDKVCKPEISKVKYDSKLNREKKVRRWKCTSSFHKTTHYDGEDLNKDSNSEDNTSTNKSISKSYINDYISMINKLFGIV